MNAENPTPTDAQRGVLRAAALARRGARLGMNFCAAAMRSPVSFALDLEYLVSCSAAEDKAARGAGAPTLDPGLPPLIPHPYDILPMAAPLNVRIDPALRDHPYLNVVLPATRMASMSGGPNTAFALCYRLANQNIPVRFVSANAPADQDVEPMHQHFMSISGVDRRLENVEIVDAHNRSIPVAFGENDIFFATAWWTAQMVKHALPLFQNKKFIYLVQDFEPGLHEFSTYYALAMETYALNFLPLVNHPILADHYASEGIGRFADPAFAKDVVIIDPAIDRSLFYPQKDHPKRPRRLLFYARPTMAKRNMFELGILALRRAVAEGLFDVEHWEFIGMGEPFSPISLGAGKTLECAPWLGMEGYAEQMRSADILLSLMLAPHPSYPPLEMAACGGLAVTNVFGVKSAERLRAISQNIIAATATIEGVSNGIAQAVSRLSDREAQLQGANELSAPRAWSESFAAAEPTVLSFWDKHLATRNSTACAG